MLELNKIQQELKAPKNQVNAFGKYKYRSCEDILEAVKPLLKDKLTLTLSDEMVQIGDRYYVKATATLANGNVSHSVTAYAREAETKKGMDESQITGAASSYARKYALNGLFLIDDTKDADTMDNTKETKPQAKQTTKQLLYVKIKNANNGKAPSPEEILQIIADKAGVNLKNTNEITEDKAKHLIEMWNN